MTDEEKKAQEEQLKHEKAKKGEDSELSSAEAAMKLKKELDEVKAENDSLRAAKKEYYDKLLNEGKIKEDEPKPKHRTSSEIREDWKKNASNNTNLRNAQLSVEYDEAITREAPKNERQVGMSYLPKGVDEKGNRIIPSLEEKDRAKRTHDVLKACILESSTEDNPVDELTLTGGDPEVFNMALKRKGL